MAGVLGLAALSLGWVRPQLPGEVAPAASGASRLDYMLIAVNGEPHLVSRDQELSVWWGDQVEVRQAVLSLPSSKTPVKVHVYGYTRRRRGRSDDRGQTISTTQLKERFSEGGKGAVYAVVASLDGQLRGAVFLRVTPPELEFAEVSINGLRQMVRSGQLLSLKRSDQLRVERVHTNIPGNAGVQVQMQPATASAAAAMRFSRGGRVFAVVPLKVGG